MKTHYDVQPYEVLRLEDGEWVWCDYGDSRDEGKVTLPKEVYDRLAPGRLGKFEVKGQRYWLKLLAVQTNLLKEGGPKRSQSNRSAHNENKEKKKAK